MNCLHVLFCTPFNDILMHHQLLTCVLLYSIQARFRIYPILIFFLYAWHLASFFECLFFLMSAPRFFSCIFQLKDWYCESIHAHFLECVLKIESQVTMHEELLVYQIFCLSPKKNVETT